MEQRVDVVVPCYRYGHFLEECIHSVLSQEVDARVLILDDASPDNTPDVGSALATRDSRVTFRRHSSNKGHIATYNEGIDWASGEFFLLLSADDYLVPGALRRSVETMTCDRDVGFTFGNVLTREHDGTIERVYPLGKSDAMPQRRIMSGSQFIRLSGARNIVPTPTAVVRTALQKRVGGYRAELPHSGDMEMWLRLASHAAVGFVNEDQGVYRRHTSNMSLEYFADSVLPDLRQRKRALEMFFDHAGVSLQKEPGLRRFLLEDLAREAARQAGMAFNNGNLASTDAIKRFALEISPRVRRSLPWAKLFFKQMIGPRNWLALNSIRRSSESQ